MRSEIFDQNVDLLPEYKDLDLEAFEIEESQIIEGVFLEKDNRWYPIIKGVPCFLAGDLKPDFGWFQKKYDLPTIDETLIKMSEHKEQLLTNTTFSDKWRRFKDYGLEEEHKTFLQDWYCKKLGLSKSEDLETFYGEKELILEVGPGSGFNTKYMAEHCSGRVYTVDISEAAFTTYENTSRLSNCHVIQADLMETPFADGLFDFVIADGVLHHTPNTLEAFKALYKKVKPGGQFFFYVYKKMGAARQFCDDYIRTHFTKLEPDACYAACEGMTELGRELSKINMKIELKKGIPVLGIPPGNHDVQRLVYYNFLKCFWNNAFDYETNNMVNFDWYHPHNAWQHTEDEVEKWLHDLAVEDYKFNNANPNGISVLLRKPVSAEL